MLLRSHLTNGLWAHNHIFVKKIFGLLLHKQYWTDQGTFLHMPQQHSCCDMCKIVTWLDPENTNSSQNNFHNTDLWVHNNSTCKMGPEIILPKGYLMTNEVYYEMINQHTTQ